jgi:peptidoglycan/LPS O-acetylase OafA/YrhL
MASRLLLSAPRDRTRSDAIDGLRALLALHVLFTHAILWASAADRDGFLYKLLAGLEWTLRNGASVAHETHPSVLAFIVLSGYCIHRNGLRAPGDDVKAYARRRVFRIVPVYVIGVLLGVIAVVALQYLSPAIVPIFAGSDGVSPLCVLAKLGGVSAFVPSLHRCSFQGNAPLVTVAVEMWLYLAYPVAILLLATRAGGMALVALLIVALGGGFAATASDAGLREWWNNGAFFGFVVYWWIGAACVSRPFAARAWTAAPFIAALWLSLAVWTAYAGSGTVAPLVLEVKKLAFAVLVGALITRIDSGRMGASLARLAPLGRASYSIYAVHGPVLLVLLVSGVHYLVAMALATAAGVAVYAAIERPMLAFGRAPPQA